MDLWHKYFNSAELPIAYYSTHNPKEAEPAKKPSGHHCLIQTHGRQPPDNKYLESAFQKNAMKSVLLRNIFIPLCDKGNTKCLISSFLINPIRHR